MEIPIYHVDAFTDQVFGGNPAAVCPLEGWLPDGVMQKIALENSIPETAFFIPIQGGFHIRWFTPEIEMDLCGHATLASAHVIASYLTPGVSSIHFTSMSGSLPVTVEKDVITLDFPSRKPIPSELPEVIREAFRVAPLEVLKSRDYVLVYESEEEIIEIEPDPGILNRINLDPGGVVVTAPGREVDFVSRYFTPQASIFEDPVTGSAHCSLIPYWSEKLGKKTMLARQLSARGGKLYCKDRGERILIGGKAVIYMQGTIFLE